MFDVCNLLFTSVDDQRSAAPGAASSVRCGAGQRGWRERWSLPRVWLMAWQSSSLTATAAAARPSLAQRRLRLPHLAGTCTGGCSCVRSSRPHAVTAWGCSPVESLYRGMPPPQSDSTGGSAAQGAAALASGLGRAQPWQPPGGKAMLNLWKNCVLTFYCYLHLRTTAWPSKLFTPIKRNYMSTNT